MPDLSETLESAYRACDARASMARDPVRFVHRYDRPEDQEIAGVFASQLAYGRVSLFGPVLDAFFDITDREGGPRAWVDGLSERSREPLGDLLYRWNRPDDWWLMGASLQAVLDAHGSLEAAFSGADAEAALVRGVGALRGAGERRRTELPRGFRYWLASPISGSTCKRWNLFLRWMVRPATEGIDLGLWSSIPVDRLVMPIDTHVFRIARFLGLTERRTANWRAAIEITEALRRYDRADPVRFDFAIAHLGISGGCRGSRHTEVCPGCPLDAVCAAPTIRAAPAR